MRQTRSRSIRKTMAALGAVALLSGVATAAAAAPPVDPDVTLNTPTASCDEANRVTVTASVESNVDLTSFRMWVTRWEDVTVAVPEEFNGFGQVEDWGADFWTSGRKGSAVPTQHTLATSDRTTWSHHGWKESGYVDSSDLFVVSVSAYAAGKGNASGTGVWDDWVIDCSTLAAPVVALFTSPWDAPWSIEQGDL